MTAPRPQTTIIAIHGKSPRIHDSAFIAPGCRIIGDVEIGPDASIWYNCTIRADVNRIVIGARSNIQDGTVIHCDGPDAHMPDGFPAIIGDDVLVGHMAMLHGCIIGDNSLIGIKSLIMNRAVIGKNCLIGANSLIPEGKVIPDGSLVMGSPGKVVRPLTEAEINGLRQTAARYVENFKRFKRDLHRQD